MKNNLVKKLLTVAVCTSLSLSLLACGKKDKDDTNKGNDQQVEEDGTQTPDIDEDKPVLPEDDTDMEEPDIQESPLSDEMSVLMENVTDLPNVSDTILNQENFEYYAFIPYIEGVEGLCSEALIGSIAHSVVMLRLPEGVDAAQVAEDVKANMNPAKWVCVEAEKAEVLHDDNTVLLVMSWEQTAQDIIDNFNNIYGE